MRMNLVTSKTIKIKNRLPVGGKQITVKKISFLNFISFNTKDGGTELY
jgi:hypothetical protein